jgi:general transcription factor 3C polypeptide 3 (transcription factor C subunit 4)
MKLNSTLLSAEDDEPGTFFDEEQDPLVFLQGMETSDRAPYELLRRRNRARPRRYLDSASEEEEEVGKEDELEEDEEMQEEEKEEEVEEKNQNQAIVSNARVTPLQRENDALAMLPTASGDEDGLGVNSDGEENIRDEWNEALAERFGLAPPVNRKKARNREKYRRRNGPSRRRRDLPEEVSRKMGEANILYATQRHQEAITLLQEVVRLAPNSPDAYHLLGLLYDEIGDASKSLNFLMIAAHLTPRQVDLWRRLAHMSSQQGLLRQALYCLTQVTKRDKDDQDAKYDRGILLGQLGQRKKAIELLEQVHRALPEHSDVVKQLSRLYYHTSQHDKAVGTLKLYWEKYPETTDLTHINLLAELLCSPELASWQEALDVLAKARRELLNSDQEMPIELEVKSALATARLGDVEEAERQLQPLFEQDIAVYDDLFSAAADTFEAIGRDDKAEPFLRALADDPAMASQLDIWRRLAECRGRLHGPTAVVDVWKQYTENLDPTYPGYMDSIYNLADAFRNAGDEEGAIQALSRLGGELPEGSLARMDALTTEEDLLQRASVLKACGRQDLLVSLALPSLKATLGALAVSDPALDGRCGPATKKTRSRTAAAAAGVGAAAPVAEEAVFVGYVSDQRRRGRKKSQNWDDENEEYDGVQDDDVPDAGELTRAGNVAYLATGGMLGTMSLSAPMLPGVLKEAETFQLMVDTALHLISSGRASEARSLAELAVEVLGKRSPNRRKRDTMRLIAGKAALLDGDLNAALQWLKSPATRWNASPAPWNAFAQVQAAAGGARQTIKFLAPLRTRNPTSIPLALMLGHAHLQAGGYASALSEYFQAYRFAPDEPLILLCIASALVNQAASRHVPDRHAAVLQAFGFFQEYSRRRRDPIEAAYNAGRAAQHLSLNFLAVPLYEQALEAAKKEEGGGSGGGDMRAFGVSAVATNVDHGIVSTSVNPYSVAPEAAFNLSLILRASGATSLAKKVLKKHLTF